MMFPTDIRNWFSLNIGVLTAVFIISLILYLPLVTGVVITNHTIPNVFAYGYPSFKTFQEARWLADLLIFLFGGQGNQFIQAVAGFALMGLNGILVADILGLKVNWQRFCIASLVSLHPTILDYYSFTADNIGFTLGDTLILVGAKIIADNGNLRSPAWGFAGILYFLGLSIYAPKVGVIGIASIMVVVVGASRAESFWSWAKEVVLPNILAIIIGVSLFGVVSAILLSSTSTTDRTEVAPIMVMLRAVAHAIPSTLDILRQHSRAVPMGGVIALLSLIIVGGFGYVWRAKSNVYVATAVVFVIALMPLALQSASIINVHTENFAGRILSSWSYATAFLGSGIFWLPRLRGAAYAAFAWLIYSYAIVASREASAMSMKNIYETELISRIVGRAEQLVPFGEMRSLVILGNTYSTSPGLIVQTGAAPFQTHIKTESFIAYRQVEIANFFAGRNIFQYPTISELEAAKKAALTSPAWPQEGSVFSVGDTSVVVLMAPLEKVNQSTWTR